MTRIHLLASAALPALLATPALAADDPFDLGVLILSAGYSAIAADHVAVTVDVVDAEDIKAAGGGRLADVLERRAGLSFDSNGGPGAPGNLRLRGLSSNYVPVYYEGIRLDDPSQPQIAFDWGKLTTGTVSRVEVLKGAQSARFGANAIGGAISMTGFRAKENGVEGQVALEAGSHGTLSGQVSVAAKSDRGEASFSLSRFHTDGYSASSLPGQGDDDGYDATQVALYGAYDVTETLRLGVAGFALESEGDFDEFATSAGRFTGSTRALKVFAELETGPVDHLLSFQGMKIDRTATDGPNRDSFEGRRNRAEYTATYVHDDTLTLNLGADHEVQSYKGIDLDYATWPATRRTGDGDTTQTGVFAEVLWTPTGMVDVMASLRHDEHSEYGGHLSYRLAAAVHASETLTFRASAASGFRAPSLYELHSPVYGNTDLDEETSRSFDLGVEKRFGTDSFVSATLFYNEVDNLIQWAGVYDQVDGTSVSQGVELAARHGLSEAVSIFGNYTYTDARDRNEDPLLRVARHKATLGVHASFAGGWNAGADVTHVADRPEEFGTKMKDYTLANADIGYTFANGLETYLRIENLFDEDYETSANYNTSGRAAFFGIRADF